MSNVPENIDLRFLAEQNNRILNELAEARAERKEMLGCMRLDNDELWHEMRAKLLETVHETRQNHGTRLNAIDGRLAPIEKRIGLLYWSAIAGIVGLLLTRILRAG